MTLTATALTPCNARAWCDGHSESNPEHDNWHTAGSYGTVTALADELTGHDVALIDDYGTHALAVDAHIIATVALDAAGTFSNELRALADQLDAMAASAAQLTTA